MLRRGFYMKKDSRNGVMLLSPMPFVSLAAARSLLCHVGRQIGLVNINFGSDIFEFQTRY